MHADLGLAAHVRWACERQNFSRQKLDPDILGICRQKRVTRSHVRDRWKKRLSEVVARRVTHVRRERDRGWVVRY